MLNNMEKLNKIDGVVYTQNSDVSIEERVFFAEGIVADVNDYRVATADELAEWEEYKKKQEEELI